MWRDGWQELKCPQRRPPSYAHAGPSWACVRRRIASRTPRSTGGWRGGCGRLSAQIAPTAWSCALLAGGGLNLFFTVRKVPRDGPCLHLPAGTQTRRNVSPSSTSCLPYLKLYDLLLMAASCMLAACCANAGPRRGRHSYALLPWRLWWPGRPSGSLGLTSLIGKAFGLYLAALVSNHLFPGV